MDNGTHQLKGAKGLLKGKAHTCNLKHYLACSSSLFAPDTESTVAATASDNIATEITETQSWKFAPINLKWQQLQANRFGINIVHQHRPRETGEKYIHIHTPPVKCVTVRGDGNCFYRVLSIAVTGTESHHEVIRNQLVGSMTTE